MSEHEFTAKRVSKMVDNAECSPADLLRMVLHEIESGAVKADGLMIVALDRSGPGWHVARYRANLKRDTEIALLATSEYKAIRDWVD